MTARMPALAMGAAFARSDLIDRAWQFACAAHEGERSRGTTRIEHPAAVAALLMGQNCSDELVAAALLHDVIEDTTVSRQEIEDAFGSAIASLVTALSEDPAIDDYAERKSQLRRQVVCDGDDAALIFLADKLARMQVIGDPGSLPEHKLTHYRETLRTIARAYPRLPFIDELARRLS